MARINCPKWALCKNLFRFQIWRHLPTALRKGILNTAKLTAQAQAQIIFGTVGESWHCHMFACDKASDCHVPVACLSHAAKMIMWQSTWHPHDPTWYLHDQVMWRPLDGQMTTTWWPRDSYVTATWCPCDQATWQPRDTQVIVTWFVTCKHMTK